MTTFTDILSAYDGPRPLADDLGVEYQTARKMIDRKSVATKHWTKLIDGLSERGVNITTDDLIAAAAARVAA